MNQGAPHDFLEAFQGFTEKYGNQFSEEVIDLTCYLLSKKHKGLNSVFMYHNNQLTLLVLVFCCEQLRKVL